MHDVSHLLSVTEAIRSRKSVRSFRPDPVSPALVEEVLSLAARAPSGGNLQPWRLRLLHGDALQAFKGTVRARIAECPEGEAPQYPIYPPDLWEPYRSWRFDIGERMYASIGVARGDKAGRALQFARNYEFFGAPVGLLCYVDRGMGSAQWADLGMYLQTVMLALRERGLHSCAQECWSLYHETIGRFVQAPPQWMLFCGMAIGHEDSAAPINSVQSPRMAFGDFAAWVQAGA